MGISDPQVIYVVNWFEPMGVCTQMPSELRYGDSMNCKDAFGKLRTPCIPGCENVKANVTVDSTLLKALFEPTRQFQQRHNVPIWVDQLGCSKLQPRLWQWMVDSHTVLGQAKVHWTWWTWKGGDMGLLQQLANAKKSNLSSYQL